MLRMGPKMTETLVQIEPKPPRGDWRDPHVEFRKGSICYSAAPKNLTYSRPSQPARLAAARQRLEASARLEAHHPRRHERTAAEVPLLPPVHGYLRALRRLRRQVPFLSRLRRSQEHAGAARRADAFRLPPLLHPDRAASSAALAGGRELTEDVIKEWFYYFYQCTECRRCSVFCPYGIDTAEITMMGRELLNLIGCNINWVLEPAANCFRIGNHLGIQPHGFKDSLDFAADEAGRDHRPPRRSSHQPQRRRSSFRHALGRLLRHAALLHAARLPDAVPRNRPRLHLQRLRLGRRQLRPVHLARDDEAPERQDLRGSQASRREVDPGRRVRPHVARAPPVYGYHERPGRFSRSARLAHYRHASSRMPAPQKWCTSASSPPT